MGADLREMGERAEENAGPEEGGDGVVENEAVTRVRRGGDGIRGAEGDGLFPAQRQAVGIAGGHLAGVSSREKRG